MRLYTPLILASTATALSGGFGGAAKTKKKKKSAAPLVEESEAYTKLRKWAIDGGATLDGVRESNGALVATKAVKKNGVLATLPSDLALALCDPDEDEADHAACAKNFFEFKYEEQFGDYVRGSALGMTLNVTRSRRWRLHETASPRRRRQWPSESLRVS